MIGEVGEVIASAREEKKLSQRQLAKLCGISNNILAKIERGTYNPSPRILRVLSENLDVNYNDLMIMQSLCDEQTEREQFIRRYYAGLNLNDLQKAYNIVKGNIFNNDEIIKELNNIDISNLSEEEQILLSNMIKDYEFVNSKYQELLKSLDRSIFYEKFNLARKVVFENERD